MKLGLDWRKRIATASEEPGDNPHGMSEREILEHDAVQDAMELENAKRDQDAYRMYRIATGGGAVLADAEERWVKELAGKATAQTVKQHRQAVGLLKVALPNAVMASDIDRRKAGLFVMDTLKASGRTQKTINRLVSSLSSFWKWMIRRGLAEENPWVGQGDLFRKRQGKVQKERPYTAEELVRLLQADPLAVIGKRYGPAIRDLTRLALMTGARLNELCELRAEDVRMSDRAIYIPHGKTAAGERVIPVHGSVWPIIERRMAAAQDGLLFPELQPGDRTASAPLALSVYSGGLRIQHLRDAIEALGEVMEPEVVAAVMIPGA